MCSLTSSCKQETLLGQEGVGTLCMGEDVKLKAVLTAMEMLDIKISHSS